MIKQVSMMKRHPDLTIEQFIDHYESRHAKFGDVLFARAARFVRRYVKPMRNPLTGETPELEIDVILEIWWNSQQDFDEAMQGIAKSDLLGAIRDSGAKLFASHNNPAFTVLEYDSELVSRQ